MIVRHALRDFIVANSSITNLLATYTFGTGESAQPAIFTCSVIPEDCGYPCMIISDVSGSGWGTQGQKGMIATCDVRIYVDKDRNLSAADSIAELTWLLLEKADLSAILASTGQGYDFYRCACTPPSRITDQDGYPGYLLNVNVHLMKSL